jgi:hypothetical protein
VSDHYHDDPVEDQAPQKRNRFSVIALILSLVGGSYLLQGTFAANISLNSSGSVEFGQGVLQTVSCSGSSYNLSITPYSSFRNVSNAGAYYLESITVSNIPSACDGVVFTLNAYNETNTSPLALFNTTSSTANIWSNAGTFEAGSGSTGMTVGSGSGTFSIRFMNPVALSSTVSRITLQSSPRNSTNVSNVSYNVGDTGPGGGKIIFVSQTGFAETGTACSPNCRYLEVAPNNWFSVGDPTRPWAQSAYTSTSIMLSQSFGFGYSNTMAIINQGNSDPALSAAALAASYAPTVGGVVVNDWFLPSEGEQAYIVSNRAALGLNVGGGSWNSSSVNALNGRFYNYVSFGFAGAPKATFYYVRPVRVF